MSSRVVVVVEQICNQHLIKLYSILEKGIKGDRGPEGDRGLRGPRGHPGPKGVRGEPGSSTSPGNKVCKLICIII